MGLFRRNKSKGEPEPAPAPSFPQVAGRQYGVALTYLARSGDAIRLAPGPQVVSTLPRIVEPLTIDGVEVVAPLPLELASAAPAIERLPDLEQWILARKQAGPVTRHALHVLEATEAVDMTIDTLICGLLHGETDTTGYPTFDAISGGLASHFDDLTGELIVRAVVGWGGKGQRGDTERIGTKVLSNLQQQVLVSGLQVSHADTPVHRDASEGMVCGHCGFDARGTGAFYCPKCGMKLGGSG
ncbi:MAG TPA: hypothetical protein VIC63_00585 [Candidatus Limnocylindria bacterium]